MFIVVDCDRCSNCYDILTKRENIVDLCYRGVKDAYISHAHPPFGFTDHNVVFLLPYYRQVLKRHNPQTYSIIQWLEDDTMQLQGSFACRDWDIFDCNLNERVFVITEFCIGTTIPVKTFKKYSNSKPWITQLKGKTESLSMARLGFI